MSGRRRRGRKRRRQRSSGGGLGGIALAGVLGMLVVWWLLVALWHWLIQHWYVGVGVCLVAVVGVSLVISGHVISRRERQERLRRLRFTLRDLDAMTPHQFETACRDLLRRDGMDAECCGGSNDRAADVIAVDSSGRRIVVQCKHTITCAKVPPKVVYEVNGTAKPVHRANIVIIATNGGFTDRARAFAREQRIHLIDRDRFVQWAEQGHSIRAMLGLGNPRSVSPG